MSMSPRDTKIPPSLTSSNGSSSTGGRHVLIHVFDEYRKIRKDFVCRRDLLLAKMKYFQAYLNPSNELDEIDISVHCDVDIFEWLIEYMEQNESEWRHKLTLENVASILVSSEFLQMGELVEECIRFITSNMQDFLQLRVDFSCLSDAAVAKIATKRKAIELQHLLDPKDKILSKLYRKKIEILVKQLHDSGKTIHMCECCELIFLHEYQPILNCQRGKQFIDAHGELVVHHRPKHGWKAEEFVREVSLRKNVRWSALYWYIWASVHCFVCSTCKKSCTFVELGDCAFHPRPITGHDGNMQFACCEARGFDAANSPGSGCERKNHVPIRSETLLSIENVDEILELPTVWEGVHNCDRIVRTATLSTPPNGSARLELQMLYFAPDSTMHTIPTSNKELIPTRQAVSQSADANALARRRQWKTLELQEKDHLRSQALARRLVHLRKNLMM